MIPNLVKVMRGVRLKLAEVALLTARWMRAKRGRTAARAAMLSPAMLQMRGNALPHGGLAAENSYHVQS